MRIRIVLATALVAASSVVESTERWHRFYEIPAGAITPVISCAAPSCNISFAPVEKATGRLYEIGYIIGLADNEAYHMWEQYDHEVYVQSTSPNIIVELVGGMGGNKTVKPLPSVWDFYIDFMGFRSRHDVNDLLCTQRYEGTGGAGYRACRDALVSNMRYMMAMPADELARCVVRSFGYKAMDTQDVRVEPLPNAVLEVVQTFRKDGDVSSLRSWSGDRVWDYLEDDCTGYLPADIDWNPGETAPAPLIETINIPAGPELEP